MTVAISNLDVLTSIAADSYAADVTPTGTDIAGYHGDILAHINVGVASSGDVAFTVQHNDVATSGDGGWASVPAAALVNKLTGAAATFTNVTTTASAQTLELKRDRLKRYIRIFADRASGTFEITGVFIATPRSTPATS